MPDAQRVVVAGASGLIGSALVSSLEGDGIAVTTLVRHAPRAANEVQWLTGDPLNPDVLAGALAVVGLNGVSIARPQWTSSYRKELLWSRLTPTATLATAVAALGDDAPAFVSGSAVGFYGDAPGTVLDESSAQGDTFLADLCGEWEAVARRAGGKARVVLSRTAPVIDVEGVLKPLVALTKAGLSGPLGPGTQKWGWISTNDAVRALRHLIDSDLEGPVNLTGPAVAANDIGFSLAVQLNRPYLLRAPSWALRLALGGHMADDLLLADADVQPRKLDESGFVREQDTVDDAIAAALAAA